MVGGLADGQLLERFAAGDGEAAELAFAVLMERHGPMVLRVCRGVLRNAQDAEDAFQATFLILARKARAIRERESLGPWLHGVAYNVATTARSSAHRRRSHEMKAGQTKPQVVSELAWDDLGPVVHEELARLPSHYRAAIVLCCLEGLTQPEAAHQLGWPLGTVQSRLARGRERLRYRLIRRGLAPSVGVLGTGAAIEAAPVLPTAALVEATIRAATPATAERASESMIQLAEGVLRSMFLIKLRTFAAIIVAIAGLAAGTQSLLQEDPVPRPLPNVDQLQAEIGAQGGGPGAGLPETDPPPPELNWTDVAPEETLRVIDLLAAQSKNNYGKIKTWQGKYSYVLRQYLSEQFVAQLLSGAQALAGKPAPRGKVEGLMQEFDSVLTFAIDVGSDAIYRDVETSRMRFLKVGTEEEVKIPNVGTTDRRSILTPELYLVFHPKERATSAFLPDHPEAQQKRRAERFPLGEVRSREGGAPDPRSFFKSDTVNFFWKGLELYARAFRGELGAEQKKIVMQRLKVGKADGPGGRWYREQMGFTDQHGAMMWVTTQWSPQAGYNPVSRVTTLDKPDGKLQSRTEWQWKVIDGIFVPSTITEAIYNAPHGGPSREQKTRLKECSLNRTLGPHQFDERGLGLSNGDLILNHLERVAYIVRDNEPVRLAEFGGGSVLRPNLEKPAPVAAARPRSLQGGRIYTTASLRTNDAGRPISSIVAVDPENGDVVKVVDDAPGRLRVSPDGQTLAYVSGDLSANASPPERMRPSLWIRAVAGDAGPKRVVHLDDPGGGGQPVWSPDGKQLILSMGTYDEAIKQWVFETFRINVDGSGRESLKIPAQDGVRDWSSDGKWVVTSSSRNAKIGWQLYVMRPDGGDQRQVTEGGNPFYARFSPDGRRLLYTDGPAQERLGIWVVDVDGKNRRRILATGKGTASACWSPDGQRIAVAISGSGPEEHGRLEIVNLDGTHRTVLTLPSREIADMPDWR